MSKHEVIARGDMVAVIMPKEDLVFLTAAIGASCGETLTELWEALHQHYRKDNLRPWERYRCVDTNGERVVWALEKK